MLLAEDNEINQLVAVRMLEKHGFRVDVAVNGRVALEMCQAHDYRAVFMDCQMPELDGYETALEIRRREGAGRHIPIIAMTANTMEGDREKCLAAGMDEYVGKPVDAEALRRAIEVRWAASTGALATRTARRSAPPHAPSTPWLDLSVLDGVGDAQMSQDLAGLFAEQLHGLSREHDPRHRGRRRPGPPATTPTSSRPARRASGRCGWPSSATGSARRPAARGPERRAEACQRARARRSA